MRCLLVPQLQGLFCSPSVDLFLSLVQLLVTLQGKTPAFQLNKHLHSQFRHRIYKNIDWCRFFITIIIAFMDCTSFCCNTCNTFPTYFFTFGLFTNPWIYDPYTCPHTAAKKQFVSMKYNLKCLILDCIVPYALKKTLIIGSCLGKFHS